MAPSILLSVFPDADLAVVDRLLATREANQRFAIENRLADLSRQGRLESEYIATLAARQAVKAEVERRNSLSK